MSHFKIRQHLDKSSRSPRPVGTNILVYNGSGNKMCHLMIQSEPEEVITNMCTKHFGHDKIKK